MRSTELRIHGVDPDEAAALFIDQAATTGQVRVIANRPGVGDVAEYADKIREARDTHQLKPWEPVLFLEVATSDASEFSNVLDVAGVEIGPFRVLRCKQPRGAERHRRPAAAHPRPHRQGAARLLRLDRRQPDRLPAEVPRLRRGRRRPR